LGFIFKNCPSQIFTEDEKEQITFLVRRKEDLLRLEEEDWHLKSRAIWIRGGDRNTKIFHKFVESRRRTNTIWDIIDMNWNQQSSQDEIGDTNYN